MNAINLYVSTSRVILSADAAVKSSWTDLFRLVPYLRKSISCSVCTYILKEPYTPICTECHHNVCKNCLGSRRKVNQTCSLCKYYANYSENLQLRVLLQSYKKLCEYFMETDVYKILSEERKKSSSNGGTETSRLIDLIEEGAVYNDDFENSAGLSKSSNSILPCLYTNSTSTQTSPTSDTTDIASASSNKDSSKTTANGSPLYSVMHSGTSNKITIKRKPADDVDTSNIQHTPVEEIKLEPCDDEALFKKPLHRSRSNKRKGCRCGNATATPGKLTCCGQRCPCYVEKKPCIECKCKGCRNPHRENGMKVRLLHVSTSVMDSMAVPQSNADSGISPSCSGSADSMDTDTHTIEGAQESLHFDSNNETPPLKVYKRHPRKQLSLLPANNLMEGEQTQSAGEDEIRSLRNFSTRLYSSQSELDTQEEQDEQIEHDEKEKHIKQEEQDEEKQQDEQEECEQQEEQEEIEVKEELELQDEQELQYEQVLQYEQNLEIEPEEQDEEEDQDEQEEQDEQDVDVVKDEWYVQSQQDKQRGHNELYSQFEVDEQEESDEQVEVEDQDGTDYQDVTDEQDNVDEQDEVDEQQESDEQEEVEEQEESDEQEQDEQEAQSGQEECEVHGEENVEYFNFVPEESEGDEEQDVHDRRSARVMRRALSRRNTKHMQYVRGPRVLREDRAIRQARDLRRAKDLQEARLLEQARILQHAHQLREARNAQSSQRLQQALQLQETNLRNAQNMPGPEEECDTQDGHSDVDVEL